MIDFLLSVTKDISQAYVASKSHKGKTLVNS